MKNPKLTILVILILALGGFAYPQSVGTWTVIHKRDALTLEDQSYIILPEVVPVQPNAALVLQCDGSKIYFKFMHNYLTRRGTEHQFQYRVDAQEVKDVTLVAGEQQHGTAPMLGFTSEGGGMGLLGNLLEAEVEQLVMRWYSAWGEVTYIFHPRETKAALKLLPCYQAG